MFNLEFGMTACTAFFFYFFIYFFEGGEGIQRRFLPGNHINFSDDKLRYTKALAGETYRHGKDNALTPSFADNAIPRHSWTKIENAISFHF